MEVQKSNTQNNLMINFFAEQSNVELAKTLVGEQNYEAFKKELITLVLNEDLNGCTPKSIFTCAVKVTNLGLSFNPLKKQAYIFPSKNKRNVNGHETWVEEATVIIDYRYILDELHKVGLVKKIILTEVYSNEFESWDKLTETIKLKQNEAGGEVVGYYCYLELTNGFVKSQYMNKAAILAHVERYPRAFKTFNKQTLNFGAMNFHDGAKKIVLGRTLKFAPRVFTKINETVENLEVETETVEVETHETPENTGVSEANKQITDVDFNEIL